MSDLADDDYLYYSKSAQNTDLQIIQSPMYPAVSHIINLKLMYLRMLRGFSEQYNTPEKNQDMLAYWKVCSMLKF
jgi:hypothetical protein